MSDLQIWSSTLLVIYIAAMIALGLAARAKVASGDDFATARRSYSPLFLAFAFAATVASGGTFIGFPAIAYDAGTTIIWAIALYPAGVYLGVLACLRLVTDTGHRFGSRSIPEFLGERYRSDAVRILVSLFSLMLFFYLAGQLVSGIVMFEIMLGLDEHWALLVTTLVLLVYIVLGGAHADIMTDGAQGAVMVALGVVVLALFLLGGGIDGGLPGLLADLRQQDSNLVGWINPAYAMYHSPWSLVAILLAHIPLGMLPHIGNKLWALESTRKRRQFVGYAAIMSLALAMLGLGGLLARGLLPEPLEDGNMALPALFIELFPGWLAALVGVGVLAAVMSTADGLVVSSSQIIANDLYRLTYAPRFLPHLSSGELERRTLSLSRLSTAAVILVTACMAWALLDMNVTLLVWAGTGGMMAAFAGPLVLGSLWKGVTRAGCFAGLAGGAGVFILTHSGAVSPDWFDPGPLRSAAFWLEGEAPNPFSCAAIGEIVSVALTWSVSLFTAKLPAAHLAELFPRSEAPVP
ncbi:MAG: sodium:solute symporter family protein [Gammaproteobacteria bacterium]|nr:sodium:solute symporter family protein [Gammaproteobacteria bacterium]